MNRRNSKKADAAYLCRRTPPPSARLDYVDGLGQSEVAKFVKVSQAKVSRLLAMARTSCCPDYGDEANGSMVLSSCHVYSAQRATCTLFSRPNSRSIKPSVMSMPAETPDDVKNVPS